MIASASDVMNFIFFFDWPDVGGDVACTKSASIEPARPKSATAHTSRAKRTAPQQDALRNPTWTSVCRLSKQDDILRETGTNFMMLTRRKFAVGCGAFASSALLDAPLGFADPASEDLPRNYPTESPVELRQRVLATCGDSFSFASTS
jgi:hypothetical protein